MPAQMNPSGYQLPSPNFVGLGDLIGDSIVDNAFQQASCQAKLNAGNRITASQAVSGNTIAQQTTLWNASYLKGRRENTWDVIQVGINSIRGGLDADTVWNQLVALVTNIYTANPFAYLLVCQMLPAKSSSGFSAAMQTIYLDVNDRIAGLVVPKGKICTAAAIGMTDSVTGEMKTIYSSGDKLHPNAVGSDFMVDCWRADLP